MRLCCPKCCSHVGRLGLCVVCEEHVAGSGFGGAVTRGGTDPHDVLKNNLRIGS